MKTAFLQLTSSDDPRANCETVRSMLQEAAEGGAGLILTPEVSNCLSNSRSHQKKVLSGEETDPFLTMVREEAQLRGVWVSIGSLALKSEDPDGRFANRSFLISPDGEIAGRYDKIHMFDVDVSAEETYRESEGYRPGEKAVICRTPFANFGMSVCYDIRFPHLYRALAQAGADVLLTPAAFSYVTGAAHWEPLLRARAIETGCFVLACAQTGAHLSNDVISRKTHGHSMAISPWGEVLLDAGSEPGISYVDLELSQVSKARGRIASLTHDRPFEGP